MSQYKQIGNAVPVNLAEALGRSLVALLNGMEGSRSVLNGAKHSQKQYNVNASGRSIQLTLFEPRGLYLVNSKPITLLGTYRKACRDWIVDSNLYNYPIVDKELDEIPALLSVRRLVLKRKSDAPLYFTVRGHEIIDKKGLLKLGYKPGGKHPSRQKYVLYKLSPLAKSPKYDETTAVCIVGKGCNRS